MPPSVKGSCQLGMWVGGVYKEQDPNSDGSGWLGFAVEGLATLLGPEAAAAAEVATSLGEFTKHGITTKFAEVGLHIFLMVGAKSNINFTLPGFDIVIPKGQSASLNLLNEDDKFQNNFDPEIRWLKPHLDMQESELFFAI
ncbi:hypothetical protein LTS18_007961, partial [Coniosporium uncinatum]